MAASPCQETPTARNAFPWQTAKWTARAICTAYWATLSILIVVPDPWALLGFPRTAVSTPSFGAHLAAFTLLGFFTTMSRLPLRPWKVSTALVVYAILIELAQFCSPPRTVELRDFAENLVGLAIGIAAARLALKPLRRVVL